MKPETITRIISILNASERSALAYRFRLGDAVLAAIPQSKPVFYQRKLQRTLMQAAREIAHSLSLKDVIVAPHTLSTSAQLAKTFKAKERAILLLSHMPVSDAMLLCTEQYARRRPGIIKQIATTGTRPKNMATTFYAEAKRAKSRENLGREIHGEPLPNFDEVTIPLPNGSDESWDRFKDGLKSLQSRVSRERIEQIMSENWRELRK